jgi:hypothetical protein
MTGSPGAPDGTMPDSTGPDSTGPDSTGLKLDVDGVVAGGRTDRTAGPPA